MMPASLWLSELVVRCSQWCQSLKRVPGPEPDDRHCAGETRQLADRRAVETLQLVDRRAGETRQLADRRAVETLQLVDRRAGETRQLVDRRAGGTQQRELADRRGGETLLAAVRVAHHAEAVGGWRSFGALRRRFRGSRRAVWVDERRGGGRLVRLVV